MKNGVTNNRNININSNNLKIPESANITGEFKDLLTNDISTQRNYESNKELPLKNNNNYNNFKNTYNYQFTQNPVKMYKKENIQNINNNPNKLIANLKNYNNYPTNPINNTQKYNSYKNKPNTNTQNYNNFTNKSIINEQKYNVNIKNPIPEGTYNKYNQNPVEVPILEDVMNSSPTQFSGEISSNNPIYPTPEPVFNMYDENNNQDNLRKSRFYENNNDNNINKSFAEFNNKNISKSEIKKEISSEVLDNLFNMNIGKELKPDAEIEVEK